MNPTRILIVEDETIVAMDLESQLKAAGHEVLARVPTAEAALELATADRPDLVLMDITLAGRMDGVEAAACLRKSEIPVVFLTAHCDEDTLERAKLTEPFGYISKPVGARALVNAIEIAALRHRLWRKLKHSEALQGAILKGAHEGIITLDHLGRVLEFNAAAEDIFGRSRVMVLGQELVDLVFRPADQEAARRDLADALRTEDRPLFEPERELTLRHATGREFPAELTLTRVALDGPLLFTAFVRDLTRRKRAEEEKDKLVSDLMEAMGHVKRLSGLLPICAWCKKIRDDAGYWQELEAYFRQHLDATFTHGICPECEVKLLRPLSPGSPAPVKPAPSPSSGWNPRVPLMMHERETQPMPMPMTPATSTPPRSP